MARSAEEVRQAWLASLAHERRLSAHTLRAYGDDTARLLSFLHGQLGSRVTERALAGLAPADIRAFITARRAEGLGPKGVQRAMAAVRSFFRHLARENLLDSAAAQNVRT